MSQPQLPITLHMKKRRQSEVLEVLPCASTSVIISIALLPFFRISLLHQSRENIAYAGSLDYLIMPL